MMNFTMLCATTSWIRKVLIQRFYSVELLESDMARKEFKEPDISDMPEPYRIN